MLILKKSLRDYYDCEKVINKAINKYKDDGYIVVSIVNIDNFTRLKIAKKYRAEGYRVNSKLIDDAYIISWFDTKTLELYK